MAPFISTWSRLNVPDWTACARSRANAISRYDHPAARTIASPAGPQRFQTLNVGSPRLIRSSPGDVPVTPPLYSGGGSDASGKPERDLVASFGGYSLGRTRHAGGIDGARNGRSRSSATTDCS